MTCCVREVHCSSCAVLHMVGVSVGAGGSVGVHRMSSVCCTCVVPLEDLFEHVVDMVADLRCVGECVVGSTCVPCDAWTTVGVCSALTSRSLGSSTVSSTSTNSCTLKFDNLPDWDLACSPLDVDWMRTCTVVGGWREYWGSPGSS